MNDKQTVEEAIEEAVILNYQDDEDRTQFRSYIDGAKFGAQWQSSQQGWVDATFSLPENRTWVLTYTKSDEIEMAHYKHGVFYRDDTLSVIYNVTHWMPLPNPPTPRK